MFRNRLAVLSVAAATVAMSAVACGGGKKAEAPAAAEKTAEKAAPASEAAMPAAAPETTAPVGSVSVPVMVPAPEVWPNASPEKRTKTSAAKNRVR